MQLHIHSGDSQPIYRQIQRQISTAIADRRLHPGEALSPEEELAEQLVVSPVAVRRAYEELVSEGLCEARGSDGVRVATISDRRRQGMAWEARFQSLVERELVLRELELARDVQRRLLPPDLVEGNGYRVVSRSRPAGVVSGDFHEVLPGPEGTVDVMVADVAGKGFAASLVMASVKAILPFIARLGSLETVMAELNRRLHESLGSREFVALAMARLETASRRLTLVNAGLPDPYLIAPDGTVHTVPVPGPRLPLGVRSTCPYQSVDVRLPPGARLLLVSDGVPETRTSNGEPLGYEQLDRLVAQGGRSAGGRDAERWLDDLLGRVRSTAAAEPSDDWTALVVESRP